MVRLPSALPGLYSFSRNDSYIATFGRVLSPASTCIWQLSPPTNTIIYPPSNTPPHAQHMHPQHTLHTTHTETAAVSSPYIAHWQGRQMQPWAKLKELLLVWVYYSKLHVSRVHVHTVHWHYSTACTGLGCIWHCG